MIIINAFKHLGVVLHHKWWVLKLCTKVGLVKQGILHDLSKFSPTEFIPSAKYYNEGKESPITKEKKAKVYSKAWLHHKGRNKHHPEYWYDLYGEEKKYTTPIIPFKYVCEMICDQISAGIVYEGKNWDKTHQLKYWTKQKEKMFMDERIKKVLDTVYTQLANDGIDKTITRNNLKEIYDSCIKE